MRALARGEETKGGVTIGHRQLFEQSGHVRANCDLGDKESARDLCRRQPLPQELEHLPLPAGQIGRAIPEDQTATTWTGVPELAHDQTYQRPWDRGSALDRIDEGIDESVRRHFLQEIAAGACAQSRKEI